MTEALEDNSETRLKLKAMRFGDNAGDGPVMPDDLQDELFRASEDPF